VFNLLDVFAGEAGVLARDFVYPPAEDAGTPLTTWIIGDLDSDDGVALVRNALTHIISEAASSRLGFVHIPQDVPKGKGPRLSTLIYQLLDAGALQHTKPEELLAILDEIDTKGNLVDVGKITADSEDNASGDVPLNSFTYSGWTAGDVAKAPGFWRVGSTVASRLGIKDARPHILINGRVSCCACNGTDNSSSAPLLLPSSPPPTLTSSSATRCASVSCLSSTFCTRLSTTPSRTLGGLQARAIH